MQAKYIAHSASFLSGVKNEVIHSVGSKTVMCSWFILLIWCYIHCH